jgi:hypothetical protein
MTFLLQGFVRRAKWQMHIYRRNKFVRLRHFVKTFVSCNGSYTFVVLKATTSRGFLARIGKSRKFCTALRIRTRDPGSVAFLTPGSGMEKNPDTGRKSRIIFLRAWK